ncbi:hypothetical protein HDU99_007580, partial [Rhizoclosmatium hyalinum]
MFRKATALYSLRRWSSAHLAFQQVITQFPNSTDAVHGLQSSFLRIHESKTGDYNLQSLFQASQQPRARLDVADFIGPVQVFHTPTKGGGRGLRTTRTVKPGELLLAVKAAAIAYPEDLPPSVTMIEMDLMRKRMSKGTHVVMRRQLVYRLIEEPGLGEFVYGLYAGPEGVTPGEYTLVQGEVEELWRPIDAGKLEQVTSYNSFSSAGMDVVGFKFGKEPDEKEEDSPTALFLQTSLINHSCLHNSTWETLGDFQIVRALQEIPKGSEVLISYKVNSSSFYERQDQLKHHLGVACTCELCTLDRADGEKALKARANLVKEWSAIPRVSYTSSVPELNRFISLTESLIAKLMITYSPNRTTFRPEMFFLYQGESFALAVLALSSKTPQEVKKLYSRVIAMEKKAIEA